MKLLCSKVFFVSSLVLLFFQVDLVAQQLNYQSLSNQYGLPEKGDGPSFKDRLWYGGGLTLGFSGGSGYSLFAFGISPMVGYKVVGPLSVGPRLSILYTSQKYPGIKSFNLFDVELSLFARVKVYKGFFIQGELGTISDQYVYLIGNDLAKGTQTRPAQYVGLGYNFSNGNGGWGQELSIMYDFYIASDINAYEQPWQYRLSFTYGF